MKWGQTMLNEKFLKDLYRSDTENGRVFRAYCDHWVSNPGSEYTNSGRVISLDDLFHMAIVKEYALMLLGRAEEVHECTCKIDSENIMDDKAC